MLSRIAESLFWIGRYVERADDTARIVDAQVQRMLEDPWVDEADACSSLLAVMGAADPDDGAGHPPHRCSTCSPTTRSAPRSIAGSLAAARENARRAREVVSSEMWEALNTTYYAIPTRVRAASAHRFAGWVRERAAVVTGIADSTMSRDTGYQFLVLGRSLERDRHDRPAAGHHRAGRRARRGRRCCTAAAPTRRSCAPTRAGAPAGAPTPRPRSSCSWTGCSRARWSTPWPPRSAAWSSWTRTPAGPGYADDARRRLAWTRSQLEFRSPVELMDALVSEMEQVQQTASKVSDAVSRRYFPKGIGTEWVPEAM